MDFVSVSVWFEPKKTKLISSGCFENFSVFGGSAVVGVRTLNKSICSSWTEKIRRFNDVKLMIWLNSHIFSCDKNSLIEFLKMSNCFCV